MKIVKRSQFMRLPNGTLFTEFSPSIFGELRIKGSSFGQDDFTYLPLVAIEDLDRFHDNYLNEEFPVSLDEWTRDGKFDESQLYAVWDKRDLNNLIVVLQECEKIL